MKEVEEGVRGEGGERWRALLEGQAEREEQSVRIETVEVVVLQGDGCAKQRRTSVAIASYKEERKGQFEQRASVLATLTFSKPKGQLAEGAEWLGRVF